MTTAQILEHFRLLDERISALEAGSKPVDSSSPASAANGVARFDDELIEGIEYPMTLSKPIRREVPIKGIIKSIQPKRRALGLSKEDWETMGLEGENG